MKYYLIFRKIEGCERKKLCPDYIIENEAVAEAFCKEYPVFYMEERTCRAGMSLEETPIMPSCLPEESVGLYSDIKCPHCGAQHFIELGSQCTLVYFPPVYKDGKVVDTGHNQYTTKCRCLECGKNFLIVEGKSIKDPTASQPETVSPLVDNTANQSHSLNQGYYKECDSCEPCSFKKLLESGKPYIGDIPCEWCPHYKYKLTCADVKIFNTVIDPTPLVSHVSNVGSGTVYITDSESKKK